MIFLDEIQSCGKARTSLKFLADDGRFDIITSGNLLGLTFVDDADTNVEELDSIPTGYETFITMNSLYFEEFLWADNAIVDGVAEKKEYPNKEMLGWTACTYQCMYDYMLSHDKESLR